MIVKEELRANVVRALVNLGLQIIHLADAVTRIGVPFGEAGNADAEAIRQVALLLPAADEAHEIGRMLEGVATRIIRAVAGRIPSQSHHGREPGLGVALQHGSNLLLRVGHAGEVGHRGDAAALNIVHDGARQLARATARAVGYAHETRVKLLELQHRLQQDRAPSSVFGGKNSKEKLGRRSKRMESTLLITGQG